MRTDKRGISAVRRRATTGARHTGRLRDGLACLDMVTW
jgi:hypothetical protein